ncbi:hypothetical protein AKI39_21780 [Bordetella sp. H567]|nr:hypothetical protein AKI39_21780 [Bordetella sp. H567]
MAHVDVLGGFLLAHAYADRQAQVFDMLKVLSTTGTGSRVLAELKALSEQGVRIAIGPRDDLEAEPGHLPSQGVAATADGQVLWDCFYRRQSAAMESTPEAYRWLIGELAQARNLAAQKGWPGVPPLQPGDVESAFMAELALRTAPAAAQSRYVPTFPAPLHEFDAAYMPEWPRGPVHFDTLGGLMPAWFTGQAKDSWDEIRTVLQAVNQTAIGQRLLSDLWVYGRSRAVMLVHRSTSGKEGVMRLNDATPIWGFDKSTLAARAQSLALTEGEAQASGAFLSLLVIHGMLASKLGMLGKVGAAAGLQHQFEQQLIGCRARRANAPGTDVLSRGHLRFAVPLWKVEAALPAPAPALPSTLGSRPSTSAMDRVYSQGGPALPTTPMPALRLRHMPGGSKGLPDAGQDAGDPGTSPTQDNVLARWLQESKRALANTFNSSPSTPRNLGGRQDKHNPYVNVARRHSGA